ncbi:MAG: 3-oxoacyl-ACP reductase [Candidatus Coatesbacteria bacterium]|nr:MAG: 3-oxoacyl-ACP reductase [Candidatus Coatesbacteria bacterium]
MELGLEGKVVVVCGASSGLGRATAEAFAVEGSKVVIASRNEALLRQTAAEIVASASKHTPESPTVVPVVADLSTSESIDRLIDTATERFGSVHVLFTNTGGPPAGTFSDFTDDDWQRAFEQLLLFVVRIIRKVLPIMKRQNFGRIINNTSIAVKEPIPELVLSNVFRSGVVSLAKTLSRELAQYNILINNLCPGYHATKRVEQLVASSAERLGKSEQDVLDGIASTIPVGRLGRPEELAALAVFLASETASNITGATIQVDGGALQGLF